MKAKKTPEELSDTDKFRTMYEKVYKSNDTGKYLASVVASSVLGIAGIAAFLWLRPDSDLLVVTAIVVGVLAPTTTSLLALMKSSEASEQAKETHLSVNSRLDAFIKQAQISARAEGVAAGIDAANARTDSLRKNE